MSPRRDGIPDVLLLRRAPARDDAPPALDPVQRSAVRHRGRVLRVLGAPGSGKSTVAVEAVVDRVRSGDASADQCLLLAPTRVAAAQLRDRVTARLGGTSTQPLARSASSLGFGILRQVAALRGDAAPRLLSGPEQDVILRDLLAGHADGSSRCPPWPERVDLALPTRAFRGELRDLLMRAVELGLEAGDLARLGREHGRQEWVAAAQVLEEYDEVTALSAPGAYDPAWILGAAADRLEDDPESLHRLRGSLRLVVVDDAQELTPAALRLLSTVAGPGAGPGPAGGVAPLGPGPDLVLVGDPDAATQTFRGADPRILAHGWTALADPAAGEPVTLVLPTAHRTPSAVRDVVARVAGHIGVLGDVTHRAAGAGADGGTVEVHLLRATSQEAAFVAATLREAHLVDEVPWSEMAVVVRGQARTSTLRRALAASGVPVAATAAVLPVRDEVAVRPLMALLGAVIGLTLRGEERVAPEVVVDALSSPIGGSDAVALRRLRRALRREELEAGGGRPSDELLAEAALAPVGLAQLGPEASGLRRVARVLAAGVAAAATQTQAGRVRWAPGVSAETVLWAMWQATGLAGQWRASALAGGPAGARADRDLDAVLALFDAAARFSDRLPGAGPDRFLDHVRSQDVPGDTLVARAPTGDSVSLMTPQGAAGRQWRLVVVAGVQEGVWPDLRLRGTLLGAPDLVDAVTGRLGGGPGGGAGGPGQRRAAQTAVRHDETRLFLVAVSRSSERLLVTAVRSEDEQPSPYLDVVEPLDDRTECRGFSEVERPMTLSSLVAALRRDLVSADPGRRGAAVTGLARLARAGVPGADPRQWWALNGPTDDRPRRGIGDPVRVRPSQVEGFGACQLRWALTAAGGDGPALGAQDVGTLVHEVAAEGADAGERDPAALRARLDAKWARLGMPRGWLAERKHREAGAMLDRLARYWDEAEAAGWSAVGAELAMRVVLGRAVISGRVDRVECGPAGIRVIDYKTGSSKPPARDLPRHAQLGTYQLAVQAGGFPDLGTRSAGAALLQLGKAAGVRTTLDAQVPLADDDDPDWAGDLLASVADGMAGSGFTATLGERCRICPVLTSCPAQAEGRSI